MLSKCVASRERDWEFARDAIKADLVEVEKLFGLIDTLPVTESDRRRIREMLTGITA